MGALESREQCRVILPAPLCLSLRLSIIQYLKRLSRLLWCPGLFPGHYADMDFVIVSAALQSLEDIEFTWFLVSAQGLEPWTY